MLRRVAFARGVAAPSLTVSSLSSMPAVSSAPYPPMASSTSEVSSGKASAQSSNLSLSLRTVGPQRWQLPPVHQRRCFSSRQDNQKTAAPPKGKPTAVTVPTNAGRFFGTKGSITDEAGSSKGDAPPQEHTTETRAAEASPSSSGTRTIGIKVAETDEIVRAFNGFAKSVNGCTQEEFLLGVKQAYYSVAVVLSALVEHVQPRLERAESMKVIASAQEATKVLEKEFQPDNFTRASQAPPDAAAAAAAKVPSTPSLDGDKSEAAAASPATKLQDTAVNGFVSTITSIIPVSCEMAHSIFNTWMLHKARKMNLRRIASPTDYILSTKLVVFARLDTARLYISDEHVGAELSVTINQEYLRSLDPAATASAATSSPNNASSMKDDNLEAGMVHLQTDVDGNNPRRSGEEHLFVVNKATHTLVKTAASPTGAVHAEVGCSSPPSTNDFTSASAGEATSPKDGFAAKESTEDKRSSEGKKVEGPSVVITLDKETLSPIPATARACAVLTVDVVVPPERFTYNFEWFYKRIIGYENEYERIAAARLFASSSPRSLSRFLDFLVRMFTGKPVEFLFSKSIGRLMGIPADIAQTPPATRKLLCMYMDHSNRWVLSDLITLVPVIESKLPHA